MNNFPSKSLGAVLGRQTLPMQRGVRFFFVICFSSRFAWLLGHGGGARSPPGGPQESSHAAWRSFLSKTLLPMQRGVASVPSLGTPSDAFRDLLGRLLDVSTPPGRLRLAFSDTAWEASCDGSGTSLRELPQQQNRQTHKQTDRRTDRQTERTDRQTDKQTDRQTDRQKEQTDRRQTDRETDRQRGTRGTPPTGRTSQAQTRKSPTRNLILKK